MNPMQIVNLYNQFKQNPMQMLMQKFDIPNGISNDPNAIVQHLLNSGQVSQDAVNRAMQMRNNPMLRQLFK